LTPDPEDSQEDLKKLMPENGSGNAKKNIVELITTKYPDFNYSDWLTEFKNALEKALTTGLEVLGLFIYCQGVDQKNAALKKLNNLMNCLFLPDNDDL
jgi:hypothetical protein